MKYLIYLASTVILLALFSSCEKNPIENDSDGNGTLSVKLRSWSNYEAPTTKSSLKNTRSFMSSTYLDAYAYKYEIKFTTDSIMSGINDSDINWVTVYESDELKKDSERDFEFALPTGEYRGFAVLQSCDFHWICDNNGVEMPITSSNCGEYNNFNSGEKVYNIFGTDGIYDVDDTGILQHVPDAGEHMGVRFNIYEDQKTTLTVRVNLLEIVWNDNDGDGTWSEGDEVDNWTLPDGVITMTDFIVDYE